MLTRRGLSCLMVFSILCSISSVLLEERTEAQSFSVTVRSTSYWLDTNGHFNTSKTTETFPADLSVITSIPYKQNATITTMVGSIFVDGQEQHIEITLYEENGTKTRGFWSGFMAIRDRTMSVTGPLKNPSLLKGIGIVSINLVGSGTCKVEIQTPF